MPPTPRFSYPPSAITTTSTITIPTPRAETPDFSDSDGVMVEDYSRMLSAIPCAPSPKALLPIIPSAPVEYDTCFKEYQQPQEYKSRGRSPTRPPSTKSMDSPTSMSPVRNASPVASAQPAQERSPDPPFIAPLMSRSPSPDRPSYTTPNRIPSRAPPIAAPEPIYRTLSPPSLQASSPTPPRSPVIAVSQPPIRDKFYPVEVPSSDSVCSIPTSQPPIVINPMPQTTENVIFIPSPPILHPPVESGPISRSTSRTPSSIPGSSVPTNVSERVPPSASNGHSTRSSGHLHSSRDHSPPSFVASPVVCFVTPTSTTPTRPLSAASTAPPVVVSIPPRLISEAFPGVQVPPVHVPPPRNYSPVHVPPPRNYSPVHVPPPRNYSPVHVPPPRNCSPIHVPPPRNYVSPDDFDLGWSDNLRTRRRRRSRVYDDARVYSPDLPSPVPYPFTGMQSSRFFFEDGQYTLQARDVVFKIHKHVIMTSPVLTKRLDRMSGSYDPYQGFLYTCQPEEFELLLSIFYPSDFTQYEVKTVAEWTSVLRLASEFEMNNIRTLAIKQLFSITTSVERIALANEYGIKDWLVPAYMDLCTRAEELTLEEGRKVGVEAVFGIKQMRSQLLENVKSFVEKL